MASIGFLIGGALVNALAFTGSNYLFSSLSKESIEKERKRHDKAIEDMQQAQLLWAKKRQQRLDYINNEITKEHKAEKRFADLSSAMQQYFIVTGRQNHYLLNQFSLIFMCRLKTITIMNSLSLLYQWLE